MSSRKTAAVPTPAARVIELTQENHRLAIQLEEAQAELRRAAEPPIPGWRSFENSSFGGRPMAQWWCDLMLWETVLNRSVGLRGIVEIGTWLGGFSGWLWAQARIRGLDFLTYDAVAPSGRIRGFKHLDVFAHPLTVSDDLRSIGEPLALFCDGGNKPRELTMFATMLHDSLSVIFVHDWGTETQPGDVPDSLEMIHVDLCEQIGGITRVFRPRP